MTRSPSAPAISTSSPHGVRGVDDERLALLAVADEVREVDHLPGDRVVGGEVAAGEQLAEVQAIVRSWWGSVECAFDPPSVPCRPVCRAPDRSGAPWRSASNTGPARCARRPAASSSTSTDDELTLVRGDKDDVFSHGYLCPKGTALKAARRRPEPHPHAADPARRHLARRHLGRGVRRDRGPAAARSWRSTAATRSASTWATRAPTTSRTWSTTACSTRASARRTSSARAPSTRCRSR